MPIIPALRRGGQVERAGQTGSAYTAKPLLKKRNRKQHRTTAHPKVDTVYTASCPLKPNGHPRGQGSSLTKANISRQQPHLMETVLFLRFMGEPSGALC